jgi:glycosyltransferase involved in cell wall biosynthesis
MPKTVQILIPLYYCDQSLFLPIEMCFSLLHTCYPQIETIVMDDCSPLPVPDHWDITEYNAVNLGFTATVNKLLRLSTADIIIICNDDIQFHPGCLDRFFDLPDMVIASPADTASGDLDGFGCCWGMTRATYEHLGQLDERFKHFYSDTEYRERAESMGVEIVKWRDTIILHGESTTFKLLDKETLLAADAAMRTSK